jgi:aryl-alcohol dehydrogenase (NADP+)
VEIVETLWTSSERRFERFVSLQPPYSMLRRVMEAEHFPMTRPLRHRQHRLEPARGRLVDGKYRRGQPNPDDSPRAKTWVGDLDNPKFERRIDVVEKMIVWAESRRTPLAELATAWVLRNPDVTSAIIGPRTAAQLESSLRALEVQISADEAAKIDAWVPPATSVL